MNAVSTTVWKDIIGQFRVNHPQLVRGWFCDLKPEQMSGGVIRIQAANYAQVRYLEQHCRLALTEAAQASTGRLVSVAFDVDETKADSNGRPPGTPANDQDELSLNPDFTFDNFVTGPCNRLAHAAGVAIAEDPGHAYNPFFVHGCVGLGKTHLLQAICQSLQKRAPETRCYYISCETFINHFIEAVECGALHQFRYRYRHVDTLVIDDIQFLAERERSQEEFFHTFNTLHQSHRQIILSADCPPSEIPSLEERLTSRFNSGLVALMDRPCLETRMAIIRKKAKLRCITVPEDVVHLVASRIDTNIRDLEGALTRIDALSHTHGGQLTIELAEAALGGNSRRVVKIPVILETVTNHFNVKVSELQGKKRSKTITYPRHVSMYLARQLTSQSLEEIGNYFGGRDHTTVLHASRAIARLLKTNSDVHELIQEMTREIRNATH